MVSIYSPSGNEQPLAEYLARKMAAVRGASGARWNTRVDEAGNFIGEIGDASAPTHLVFLGHIDTVRGEIPVRVENGDLHGRGAVDAKSPIAAFLAGATRATLPAAMRVTCIGAVEEETSSSKGARHVVNLHRPDYLIIGEPSGWDALCLGYKGNCHTRLTIEQPKTHGASSVASAGTRACEFWRAVIGQAARQSAAAERTIDRVTVDVRAMQASDDGLTERATLTLDIRTPAGFDTAEFRDALAAATPATGRLEYLEMLPAARAPKTGPLVREFRKSIRQELAAMGEENRAEPRLTFKTATSDMNIVAPVWQCPMLAYGPGDSSLDHTPHERVSIEEYLRAVRVIQRALSGLG